MTVSAGNPQLWFPLYFGWNVVIRTRACFLLFYVVGHRDTCHSNTCHINTSHMCQTVPTDSFSQQCLMHLVFTAHRLPHPSHHLHFFSRGGFNVLLQLKNGGVAKAKGEGEKEKECTTECKSRRRRDEKAPWAVNYESGEGGGDAKGRRMYLQSRLFRHMVQTTKIVFLDNLKTFMFAMFAL